MSRSFRRNPRSQRLLAWLSCGLSLLGSTSGCSRTFWRDQADRDSYHAITETLTDPRWAVPRIDVTADPRSRFYDPYNPDCEPLPPDDPAAHVYMHWVDGWEGYKGWHKFGTAMSIENPQWLANFGITEENVDPLTGEIVGPLPEIENLTLIEAVELAQINNRQYQFEIEDVYFAALAVTFQRFQFGVRYLGSSFGEPFAGATGNFVPHGPGDNVNADVGVGVSQLLPAGTQWAVEFANNTIWLFGGGSETSSLSNLSFSIVQPLLFGAGRKVGLEGLTQSERLLLYQARDLARFRQILFTNVVGGSGYLGLLQQLQGIRNEYENIRRTEEQVERLLAQSARNTLFANAGLDTWPPDAPALNNLPPEITGKLDYSETLQRLFWRSTVRITDREIEVLRNLSATPAFQAAVDSVIQTLRTEVVTLDVLDLQSSLTNSLNRVRQSERGFQDDLDEFKLLLGLPTDMVVTLDDSLLEPFEIIDPRLNEMEQEAMDFTDQYADLNLDDPDQGILREVLNQFRPLAVEVANTGISIVERDLERVEQALPDRLAAIENEEDRERLRSDIQRARFLLDETRTELRAGVQGVDALQAMLQMPDVPLESRLMAFQQLRDLRETILRRTQNLSVIQVSLRVELITVRPFRMSMQEAVQLGMENRVDLMNARARVMDARRQVEITANALQANLDVVVEGDFNTPAGNKPFDFRGNRSRLRAGIAFTAPLDQINERNAYRAAQIDYQRARREYMLFEDEVKEEIRDAWRALFVLQQNLETSRRAVRLAALQYDAAVEESNAPVSGQQVGGSRRGSGVQGNNLSRALLTVLNAQNQLVQIWTQYETNRLNIYRDMGIMEIGADGIWTDPFYLQLANEESDEAFRESSRLDDDRIDAARLGRSSMGRGAAQPIVVEEPQRERIGVARLEGAGG